MKYTEVNAAGIAVARLEFSSEPNVDLLGLPDGHAIVSGWSTPDGANRWNGAFWEVVDATDLGMLKATKNSEINASRLAANRSYFVFAGKQIACDELSRSDIDGVHGIILMTSALPPGWPGGWKAIDNTYVAIPDVPTWGAFYAAMVAQGMSNFAKAQALKAQLAAATTAAQVAAIVW